MKIIPISMKVKMKWFHKIMSRFMKSVLDSYPFFKTRVLNPNNETFKKQAVIIANHTSFLDILAIGMLHPKLIFLVNDWVYNSPFFGKAVKLAGFYPVSSGIENGVSHLQTKIDQGYSLVVFPEGTRTYTHKMKRFHKGAFFLANEFKLDIVPVIIHGNSEILPKGNFVIKPGKLTIKILDRIPFTNTQLGTTVREKTKSISTFFKSEFKTFRSLHEDASYFHGLVLEDYRYKGDLIYKTAKSNLNKNKEIYKLILDNVEEKDSIINISDSNGELEFLLALDSPSRVIKTYLKNDNIRALVKNSYISNNNYKIEVFNAKDDIFNTVSNTLILNISDTASERYESISFNNFKTIILLFETIKQYQPLIEMNLFKTIHKTKTLLILKKHDFET